MADREQLLKSALDLAGRGFKVFPLKRGAKTPAFEGWQGAATQDEVTIKGWWKKTDFNIGVLTGDGLVVIDIDVKNGKPGAASWKALDIDVDTFVTKTASGGRHVYLAGDADCSVDRLGPGLDVRGRGGYVVGPGSVLTNGSGTGSYAVTRDAGVIAKLPAAVEERLGGARFRLAAGTGSTVDLDRSDAILRSTAYLVTDAPVAVEGSAGDLATFKVACVLKDYGVSESVALDLMEEHWNDRCEPPWEYEHLQEKVANAYAYGENRPGSGHPIAVFGDVVVDPVPPRDHSDSRWYRHGDTWDRNVGWLYYQALPATGVAVLVGPPQSGKTFLELELARSLATGKPFFRLAPDVRGGAVFLFAGTEGSGLPMRLEALGEPERLPISSTSVQDLSGRGALDNLLATLREEGARIHREHGVSLKLVVLETLSASGLVIDENNNAEAARAMANLGTIARELGVLFMTTAHPPKAGNGVRGASAVVASADYVLEITREGTDNLRRLEITKARDAEQRMLGTFTLVKTQISVDDKNRPITSMTVSMGDPIIGKVGSSSFAETLMTAVDHALLDRGDLVGDNFCVDLEDVKAAFTGLKSGSKNKSNVNAAFKHAFTVAENLGALGSVVADGVRYIWKRETSDD